MRDIALMCLAAMGLTLAFVIIANQKPAPKPLDTTPRLLDCEPDFYAGREVRVKVEGCEPGDGCLTYRKRSDQPPCVSLRFKGAVPDKLPAFVTGTCQGRQGAAVVVTDCRP